ncbi:hypothetical protein C8R45DRAFT_1098080 [Mycena sanguinolenta]|nr:hypothetical protein C8R45DRAFT_1098080 [Mycena sanguinolenta]
MSRPTLAPGVSTQASLPRDNQGTVTSPKSSHSALASQTQAEDSTVDAAESYYSQVNEWKDKLDDFFTENASTINSAENVLSAALDVKNIEEKFTALAQTSKTIMAGLDILGQIHPFISRECQSVLLFYISCEPSQVAAQAFKLAINVDVTRRENDKKVLAVQLQMQDMIVVLFLLRHLGDPKEKVGGQTVETRMRGLVQSIANHVTSGRSACEEYQKKGFVAKMIKSKIYEDRLATYAQIFADDKREIQFSLQLYATYGVNEIKQKIDQQRADFKEQMQELFRKLETSRERDIRNLIESNHGAQNCVENEEILRQLFTMAGENLMTTRELAKARKSLQKELAEEVDEVFKKRIGLLSYQLEKQNDRLASDKEEILAALDKGPHTKIVDPDLREIWRGQRWPGSIRGEVFISGLNEYYEEKLTKSGDYPGEGDIRSQYDSERWVLEYINIAHAKPIIEAIADDGSGLVNAKEVNDFTALKPNDWSLTDWIVFWAVGWYPTVAWYKEKIGIILSQSTSLSQYAHLDNLLAANTYFASSAIRRVRLLLRSTHSPSRNIHVDVEPRLKNLTEDFRRLEEELLKNRLEERSYFLDQRATVQQVSNYQRIDHYIFPLLYLLLNHHWGTMQRAGREPLADSEFTRMSTSLDTVFKAVEGRVDDLEAMFEMHSLNVKEHLSHFSFGMFHLLHDVEDDEHSAGINLAQDQNKPSLQKQGFDVQESKPIIRGGTGGGGGYGGKRGGAGGVGEASHMNLEDTKYFKEINGGVGGKGGKSEGEGGSGGKGEGNKFLETPITEGWLVEPNPDVNVADLKKHGLDEAICRLLVADGYRTVGDLLEATENDLKAAGLTSRGRINQLKATLKRVPPKK